MALLPCGCGFAKLADHCTVGWDGEVAPGDAVVLGSRVAGEGLDDTSLTKSRLGVRALGSENHKP